MTAGTNYLTKTIFCLLFSVLVFASLTNISSAILQKSTLVTVLSCYHLSQLAMCPPAASPASNIDLYYSDKDIFTSLDGIISGSPLPSNVISDVNPYQHKPSNLPNGIWFFISSKMRKDADFGYWRTKGEACRIFSNSSITGWRSTLEFYEGQAPHWHKTDWVMQEYWITRKILSKDFNEKENGLLCNVFFVGEQNPNPEKTWKMAEVDTASQSTQVVVQKTKNHTGQGSTSKRQINEGDGLPFIAVCEDNDTEIVRTRERVSHNLVDIEHETDYLPGGDFLELLDLENPASPSSSSDSSCLTMSSDECFDALDLLRDLESEKSHAQMQNNPDCKLSVFASSRPTEMVMYPAPTGTLDKPPNEEFLRSNRSIAGSASSIKITDKKVLTNPDGKQKPDFRNEGAPSTSRSGVVSLSGDMAAPEEDRKAARGRMKKLKKKYLCFMPF